MMTWGKEGRRRRGGGRGEGVTTSSRYISIRRVSAPAARDHVALSLYDVASSTTCHRHSSALLMEPSYNEYEEKREEEGARRARTCTHEHFIARLRMYTYVR